MLVTEDRSNRLEIQPGSGAIDQTLKDGFQIPTTPEQEVPAVLGLIDRERVLAVHLLLFGHIQGQTETLGEPTPQDLLQAPYRAGLAQGICDPVQVCDIVPIGETVALLGEADSLPRCLVGHIFMAVENNQPRPEAVVLGRPPEGADYVRLPPLGAWSWSGPSFLPGTGRGFSVDDDFQAYPLSCESLPKP